LKGAIHEQCTQQAELVSFYVTGNIISNIIILRAMIATPHGACSYNKTQCCSFEPYSTVQWKMHCNTEFMKYTTPAILPANTARSKAMQDVSALIICMCVLRLVQMLDCSLARCI